MARKGLTKDMRDFLILHQAAQKGMNIRAACDALDEDAADAWTEGGTPTEEF